MKIFRFLLLAALMAFGAPLFAQIAGPVFPAPGGNMYSSVGSPVDPGGVTFTYSNFDPSTVGPGNLYWGFASVNNPCAIGCDGSLMTLASFTPTGPNTAVAIYNSTSNLVFNSGFGGTVNTPTQLVVTITGPNPAGALSTLSVGGLPGFGGGPQLVVPVDTTGSYTVNFEYEVGGVALATFFENEHGGGGLTTNSDGEFWYVTPEPSSFLLMGTGLLGFAGILRSRWRVFKA